MNLGERAISFEGRVEDVERSIAPATSGRTALDRIAADPDQAPDHRVALFSLKSVDRVQ
jgi:hypothetical protein